MTTLLLCLSGSEDDLTTAPALQLVSFLRSLLSLIAAALRYFSPFFEVISRMELNLSRKGYFSSLFEHISWRSSYFLYNGKYSQLSKKAFFHTVAAMFNFLTTVVAIHADEDTNNLQRSWQSYLDCCQWQSLRAAACASTSFESGNLIR